MKTHREIRICLSLISVTLLLSGYGCGRLRRAEPVDLIPWELTEVALEGEGFHRIQMDGHPPFDVRLFEEGEADVLEINQGEQRILPPTPISPYLFPFGRSVRIADINEDGIPDLIVRVYVGGNGWNAVMQRLAFLLSGPEGYELRLLENYEDENLNFYRLGGRPIFVRRDLKCDPVTGERSWMDSPVRFVGTRTVPVQPSRNPADLYFWIQDQPIP